MKIATMNDYLGKQVKILLRNNFYYFGVIKEIKETDVVIEDKNNKTVSIASQDIVLVEDRGHPHGN
jgi:small nuclear ribonucleoprotein (snRNP)-like protein